jgi:hypothetical protein
LFGSFEDNITLFPQKIKSRLEKAIKKDYIISEYVNRKPGCRNADDSEIFSGSGASVRGRALSGFRKSSQTAFKVKPT